MTILIRRFAPLVVFSCLLSAQWMPFVAKHRLTQTVTHDDGSTQIDKQEEGIAVRSSQGSEMRTLRPVAAANGVAQGGGTAKFQDASTGNVYEISSAMKTYWVMDHVATPWVPATPRDTPSTVTDRRTVNGIACVALPVQGKGLVRGAMWRSMEYDMIVKLEMVVKLGTSTTSYVEEIYDIQLGIEPDKSLLRLPRGYTRIDSPASAACVACPRK